LKNLGLEGKSVSDIVTYLTPVRKREPMNRPPQMAKPIPDNLVKASGVFAG
jgi:hypothetical protein